MNPNRAQITSIPESSDYTSVQKHIKAAGRGETLPLVMPFTGDERKAKRTNGISFALKDYLELVEATGQIARQDKRGRIDDTRHLFSNASISMPAPGKTSSSTLNQPSAFGPAANNNIGGLG